MGWRVDTLSVEVLQSKYSRKMPGGRGNIRPEDNPKPWIKGQTGNPKGQPPSIKRQLKELLRVDGVLVIPKEEIISVNDDGSVSVNVPSQLMIAMKLEKWVTSSNGNESLKAIQMIMEQVDGKPHQTDNVNMNDPIQPIQLTELQFLEVLDSLKPRKPQIN